MVISPDPIDYHQRYGKLILGEDLPWLVVSDQDGDIARRYGAMREEEHAHGGFRERALWIVNRDTVITHRALPWEVNGGHVTDAMIAAFRLLFTWTGAENSEYVSFCSSGPSIAATLKEWLGDRNSHLHDSK